MGKQIRKRLGKGSFEDRMRAQQEEAGVGYRHIGQRAAEILEDEPDLEGGPVMIDDVEDEAQRPHMLDRMSSE